MSAGSWMGHEILVYLLPSVPAGPTDPYLSAAAAPAFPVPSHDISYYM